MKITCDSCGAKYTVSDDKVQGKTVKVKCRKCSAVIVVSATGAVQTTGGAAGPEVTFTVSVSDTDQRTMTMGQIVEAYNEGSIDAETYVWAEGMGDWQPLKDVDAIVDALHDAASHTEEPQQDEDDLGRTVAMADAGARLEAHYAMQGQAATPAPAWGAAAPAYGGGGGDLSSTVAMQEGMQPNAYGAPAARKSAPAPGYGGLSASAGAGGLFGTSGGMGSGGGMFGGASAAGAGTPAMFAPTQASFGGGAPAGGKGEENSAIFSLNMLTAKAGNAPVQPTTTAKSSSEDSGLIDLRALASGAGAGHDGGGGVMAQMPVAPAGDLFPLGAPPPVQAMPSVMPQAAPQGGGVGKGLIIGLAAAVVLLAGGLVFVIVRGPSSDAKEADTTNTTQTATTTAAAPETAKVAEPTPSATPSADASADAASSASAKIAVAPPPRGTVRQPPPTGKNTVSQPPPPTSKQPPPPPKSTGGGGCNCQPTDLMCNMRCAQKKK